MPVTKNKQMKMKTPITYYGGKQNMLKHIRPLIPPHSLYCEPFVGGAAVFFDKQPVRVNVINDLNGELINFYRTIVTNLEELRMEVNRTLHCRSQHAHAWHIYNNPDYFTNVQRAWAVFILSKMGFSGQLGSSFGFDRTEGKTALKLHCIKENEVFCEELKKLLEKSTIECDDAFKIIKRYDCTEAFHFIDPPYVNSNMGHYSGMFNRQNLTELLELCAGLQGKFMLTMFPDDAVNQRAENAGWIIHKLDRRVSACLKIEARRRQEEWMVCNYTI
ncbi:Modification methylase DpnIIA [termite gut metagenome]|uniref:site-specific DNA-methyltransferase (adenine-specific) n=1 Tax=termite gut metagenome TaxID=433724 RepID=A0A5J4RUS6_9ZZZZ